MLDTSLLQKQISELAKKHKLSLIVLFGSQAVGNTHAKSDIDIAVISRSVIDKFKIMDDFESLFKREDVEVVNLADASPTLMYCVVRDGKLLYENEEDAFFKWKMYAMWVWRDTAWLRRLRDKKLLEWTKTV
jgi:predicted nucleotidyltransferase